MPAIAHPNLLLDALENGVMIIDEEGCVHYWNQWLEINTGYDNSEICGKKLQEIYPHIDYVTLQRKIRTTLRLNTPTFYDTTFQNRFISIKRMKVSAAVLPYMQLQVTVSPYMPDKKMVMIAVYDISAIYELKMAVEEQRDTTAKLNRELQHDKDIIDSNLLIIKTDADLKITHLSKACLRFLGYGEKELLGWPLQILYSDRMASEVYGEMKSKLLNRERWSGEIEILVKDQRSFWMEAIVSPFIDYLGNLDSYTVIYHDVSDKKRIELLAVTDPLTSLYNRLKFDEVLGLMLLRENWNESNTFAIILVDVDHFKNVNDTYGHLVGDKTLVRVAETLRETARIGDIVARWGGEEFIVLLQNVDEKKALYVAEKLRAQIAMMDVPQVKTVTASFGVSIFHRGDTQSEILNRADAGLYAAKAAGRNCVQLVANG